MSEPIVWSGEITGDKLWGKDKRSEATPGFRKVWYLDVQWSNCPVEVEKEVEKLWAARELGNDYYFIDTSLEVLQEEEEEKGEKTSAIIQWIKEQAPGISPTEQILIHWWW